MVKIKCKICSKEFKVRPYRIKTAQYCSKKCWTKGMKGRAGWCKGMKGLHLNTGRTHFKKGSKGHWKCGKIKCHGYILIYNPTHPFKVHGNYIMEHRLVMEKHLGRYLTPEEVVHHINEIRDDNRIENLELFSNNGRHLSFHFKKMRLERQT